MGSLIGLGRGAIKRFIAHAELQNKRNQLRAMKASNERFDEADRQSFHRFRPLMALWMNEEEKLKAKYAPRLQADKAMGGIAQKSFNSVKGRRQSLSFSNPGNNLSKGRRRQSMW